MNFGSFEGQRWDSISARAFDDWTADFWQHRFGGAESVSDLMTRVSGAWDEAQAKELTLSLSQMPGRDHVWITHAGVIRATRLLAQGVREVHQAIQWPLEATGYGAWCKLAFGAAQS